MRIEPNTFICADSKDVLREIPNGFCDLVLTDPPYGIGECRGQHKSRNANRVDRRTGTPIVIKHDGYKTNSWDLCPPAPELFTEMKRISKHQIVWGGNYFAAILGNSPCWLVWDKVNGECDFADCELAWTSFPSAVRLIAYMWCGFLQGKSIKEGRTSQGDKRLCEPRVHPTQKPVPLFVWCLLNYSKPGDLVIDPFCGSGTTALACHKTGRRFICIDREPEYVKIAQQRYEEMLVQRNLFEEGAPAELVEPETKMANNVLDFDSWGIAKR
jgi:site-specific DNA-methyltransferase (adenine-specific)